MRGAGGFGAVETASVDDKEIDDAGGDVVILWRGGGRRSLRRNISCGAFGAHAMLCQPDSLHGMNFLELVLAQKIQDRASGIALHGLRTDSLNVNIAG